mgnify:CR=1 FL=1
MKNRLWTRNFTLLIAASGLGALGGIVGGFMEDLFGKELKPWQRSEKQATD